MIELLLVAMLAITPQSEWEEACETNENAISEWASSEPAPSSVAEIADLLEIWHICNPETDEDALYAPVSTSRPPSEGNSPGDTQYRGMGADVEQWRWLVETHFDPQDVETALCLMSYESGGNPTAKNPNSSAAGLFQFLRGTWDNLVPNSVTGGTYSSGQVYDPVANVRSAAWLQNAAGWSQWSPWNAGKCRGL